MCFEDGDLWGPKCFMPGEVFNRQRITIHVRDFVSLDPRIPLHVHSRYNCYLCDLVYGPSLDDPGTRRLIALHLPVTYP